MPSVQLNPSDEPERLQSISSLVLEEPSFLLLRNSLRYQFTRSADVAALAGGSGSGNGLQGIENIISSNLVNVLRGASAGSGGGSSSQAASNECTGALVPSGFSEGLKSTAIDFVVKALSNRNSCSKPLTQLPQTAEQRHALASRLNRDSMVWCTRGIDSQLRARWTRAKKAAHPSSPRSGPGSPLLAVSQQDQQNQLLAATTNTNKPSSTTAPPPAPQDPLGYLVHAAQREWRALINVRVESLKILTQYPLMRSSAPPRDHSDAASSGSTSTTPTEGAGATSQRTSSSNGAAPALTVDDLLGIMIERINGAAPAAMKRRAAVDEGGQLRQRRGSEVQIENLGYFTAFHSTVHTIVQDEDVVPTISDLRECLADLDPTSGVSSRPDHNHLGPPTAPPSESLFFHLIDEGDRPDALCTHAIGRGITPSLRRLVYAKLLHLPLTLAMSSAIQSTTGGCSTRKVRFATANSSKALAESAQQGRLQWNASQDPSFQARQLVRQMVATDVASRVGDSDKYFVFADESTAVATSLLEDRSIADFHLKRVVEQRGEDPRAYVSAVMTNSGVRVPACGVMPFAGSTTVLGPLNYVTGDLCEMYELAAAFQGQLWSPLQSATVDLLGAMLLFEQLAAHFAPAAVFHCNTKLSLSPLAVAMRWMVTGFADVFEPAEVLMLWDVLVGVHCRSFFGLSRAKPWWVLAAMAAAVFSFRGALVLQCFTASQVFKVFEDGVKLSPIALLQQLLFLM